MKILILLIIPLFMSCGESTRYIPKTINVIPDSSRVVAAKFILDCIENANPKSDEEPEDWLHICERMATNLYGVSINGYVIRHDPGVASQIEYSSFIKGDPPKKGEE
jgi:hypothetical protein